MRDHDRMRGTDRIQFLPARMPLFLHEIVIVAEPDDPGSLWNLPLLDKYSDFFLQLSNRNYVVQMDEIDRR